MPQHTRVCAAIAASLISVLAVAAPADARIARVAGEPDVRSNSVLVIDEGSSRTLMARQADVATPIASITKLMTAIVVLEAKQSPSEMITITDEDTDLGRASHSRLVVGTRLSRDDLVHVALMSSENRAANALCRHYPGGLPACVAAMNAKARQLGMNDTHFVEPTGLSSDNVASAGDLAKLVIAASHVEAIRGYSTDESHELRVRNRMLEFHNTDLLVQNPAWHIVVQKTGYISEAGRCLVLKAIIHGRSVVIVLLDSFGKYTRVADAERIRKWLEAQVSTYGAWRPV